MLVLLQPITGVCHLTLAGVIKNFLHSVETLKRSDILDFAVDAYGLSIISVCFQSGPFES